jgi:hypothetical protein
MLEDFKKYPCGAIPSKPDSRDFIVKAAGLREFPRRFLSPILPKIKEQTVSSCVAHSGAYICEAFYGIQFGVGFLYGFRPEGYHLGEGMISKEAAQTLTNVGNVLLSTYKTEKEMPYIKQSVDKNINKLVKYASKRKLGYYERCYTREDIKSALMDGKCVEVCMAIGKHQCDNNAIFRCQEALYGYHEMTVWGWDVVNGKEYFYAANSWGADWGNKGFCYLDYDDIKIVNDVLAFSMGSPDTTFKRELSVGMQGNDVTVLEQRLNQESGIKINAHDGIFNDATRRAVELYQKRYGLPITGVVDKKMWLQMGL